MSDKQITPNNWQAFGEQLIEMAENTLSRDAKRPLDRETFVARTDARRILRLAETLRLVPRVPMEMPAHTGDGERQR